jgi:predicted  nucleic acid-binding Zn-ribbon protein
MNPAVYSHMNNKNENTTAYEEKVRAQLEERRAEIDKLKAKMDQKKAEAKIEYQRRLDDLEQQQVSLESKLDELSEKSGSALDELKSGISDAWNRFSESVESARKEFN